MKVPAAPTVKVVLAALVKAGASLIVRAKVWAASGLMPLAAARSREYTPPSPPAGVPARVAVLSPLSVKDRLAGSVPVRVIALMGKPVVVTSNVPALPTVKVVLAALVMAGGVPIVRVKVCVALGSVSLLDSRLSVYTPSSPGSGVPVNIAESPCKRVNVKLAGKGGTEEFRAM